MTTRREDLRSRLDLLEYYGHFTSDQVCGLLQLLEPIFDALDEKQDRV